MPQKSCCKHWITSAQKGIKLKDGKAQLFGAPNSSKTKRELDVLGNGED